MSMFCFQCQETFKNHGCTVRGVCGKTDDVSNLQDALIFALKGMANYSSQLRKVKKVSGEIDGFLFKALFSTITNANFDAADMVEDIKKAIEYRKSITAELEKEGIALDPKFEGRSFTTWEFTTKEDAEQLAPKVGVLRTENEDVRSLREIILYGLKGISAYGFHAYNLGRTSDDLYAFYEKALLATEDESLGAEELTNLVFDTGKHGVDVMALLD